MVFPVIMVAKVLYLKKRATSDRPVKKAMPMARRFLPCALTNIDDDVFELEVELEVMDKADDLSPLLAKDLQGSAVFGMGLDARARAIDVDMDVDMDIPCL
jgi:hypothetical protein